MVNLGEPADLLRVYGRRCVARWRYEAGHQADEKQTAYGWISDGRWWADTSVVLAGGRIFPVGDDDSARRHCAAMRARHGAPERWHPAVAEYEPGVAPGRPAAVPPYPPGDPRGAAVSLPDDPSPAVGVGPDGTG